LPLRAIVLRLARLETPRAAGSETRLFPARPRAEALALALLLSATYVLYVTVVGGDYEPTLRFYMPVLPLLYLLFQEAMRGVTAVAGSSRRRRAIGTAIALLGFASTFVASEERFLKMLNRRGWPYTRMEHHRELRFVGEWLRYNTRPRSLIAVSSIGALPYFAERPIVDMMGLTDAHIGRRRMEQMGQGAAGHEKGDGAYVLARRPDVILFDKGHLFDHEASLEEVLSGARGVSELEIAQNREFLQRYDLRRIATPAGVLHYFVIREAR
jgi:hypothetical protein